jgi:photosystem II stability/assembly factor-like uncharacterized protein
VGGGGALFAPSFSPHNSNELFIACDLGAVFHSTTLGTNWDTIHFRQLQGNRGALIQFTTDPLLLYTLDYTSISGGDTVRPSRSTDGGATWQPLASDPTFGGAYTLFADINATNRIVVSDYSSIYFSDDGGQTFAQKFATNSPNGCLLAGAFFDGTNIFVGSNLGLFVSTNSGNTFALASIGGIPSSQAIYSFAGAKQGGTTRFFAVALNSGDVFPGLFIESSYSSYRSIYSLDWGQPNWVAHTNGIIANDFPVFVGTAQGEINTAYVTGQNSVEIPVIYKTTNAGTNWQSVLVTANNQNVFTGWAGQGGDRQWTFGAGALGFAVAPNDVNKAAFTDLGFIHMTTNGGATWMQRYLDPNDQNPAGAPTPTGRYYHGIGLEQTTCWGVTWADSNRLVSSFSDIRGVLSTNAGSAWSFAYTGHTLNSMYRCIRHPVSGALYAATSSIHDMYQSTHLTDSSIDPGIGRVLFSIDKGSTWQTMLATNQVLWVAADPTNSNRLYAAVVHSVNGGIFVSTNIQNGVASTWTKLPNPPRTQGHPFNIVVLNDGAVVCSFSGRRAGSPINFTASSGVFYSTNNGASWLDRSDANMQYWTKDVVIDPHDPAQNTWYACVFNGYGGLANDKGGLYRTTNRGLNWTRIADNTLAPSGLTDVESCTVNPSNPNEMFFGTQYDGLWCTTNLTATMPTFFEVTNYPFRQPVRTFFNPHNTNEVWVTSFGHGMYVGLLSTNAISPTVFPPGDVDGDLHVTGADSLLINQELVGLRSSNDTIFAAAGFANGDVNQTTGVTGGDSLLINQVLAGLRSYVTTKILPGSHSNSLETPVTIFGIGFPTNEIPVVSIGAPVSLTLSNVVVISREQITAVVPAGGGTGTGMVNVVATQTNGVLSFGRFVNQ